MFLLFDKVPATHGSDYSWKIGVAHSKRVKGERTSHHVKIAHIGSFKVRNWEYKERGYWEAEKLWEKADRVLKELGLAPDDEANLRRALEKRIPRPPAPSHKRGLISWRNHKNWPYALPPKRPHAVRKPLKHP